MEGTGGSRNQSPPEMARRRYAVGESAARNARILASIDDVIQVVSIQGHLLATNLRGAQMRLADRTYASAGKPWREMWLGAERIAAEIAFCQALAGRTGFLTAQAHVDSGTAWFDIVLTPMLAQAGGVSEVLVISRDISIRHAAEEQLRRSEEHYRHVAIALQTASLPNVLPKIDHLEIDAYYSPSSENATICGDWYDVISVGDEKMLFTIGDIAGHGLQAAVTMTRVKQTMEAVGFLTPDPTLMLRVANETMRGWNSNCLLRRW